MRLKVRRIKDIAVVEPLGKININSSKVIEAIGSLLNSGIRKIVIDMENVDSVDYNGLSVLAITYKSALNQKARINLCAISPSIMELFRVSKLDEVFEIYTNLKGAVESLQKDKTEDTAQPVSQPLRRRFMRMELDTPIFYRIDSGHPWKKGEPLNSGRVANLSGAGVFIRTVNILPAGTAVQVEMNLAGDEKATELKGMVLWLADKALQPELYPGMGITFARLTTDTQGKIVEFVEKHTVKRSR